MKLDLLDTPIRATWDLHADGVGMTSGNAEQVLQAIVDARLFFVTLEKTPLNHPEYPEIVAKLAENGVQVLLMTDGQEDEVSALSGLPPEGVQVLLNLEPFMTGNGPDYAQIEQAIKALRSGGVSPGVSLVPDRENVSFIVPLLEFCKQFGIPRFKLPNVRIDGNFLQSGEERFVRPEDLEKLKVVLGGKPLDTGDVDLVIHDLFLWELMTPDNAGGRSEYGGCQAGNSLAHINIDGTVLPCVSWPEPLGNLLDSSFADIWMSDKRRGVCEQISCSPPGCGSCRDYEVCFGGCRGLAMILKTDGGLDPMCNGPR